MPPSDRGGVFTWWRRKARWLQDVILLGLLVVSLAALYGWTKTRHGPWPRLPVSMQLRAGATVPEIQFSDLSGAKVSLGSLRGEWVMLYFTQPGCAACEWDLQSLSALSSGAELGRLKLFVLIVGQTVEGADPAAAAAAYAKSHAAGLRVIPDPDESIYSQFADSLRTARGSQPVPPPFCLLFDPIGRVVFAFHGLVFRDPTGETFLKALRDVMQGKTSESVGPTALVDLPVDAWVELVPGGRVRIADMSKGKTIVITLVDADSRADQAWKRARELLRYAVASEHLIYIFIWNRGIIPPLSDRFGELFDAQNVLHARAVSPDLLMALSPEAAYRMEPRLFLPVTAMIRDGAIVMQDQGEIVPDDVRWPLALAEEVYMDEMRAPR